MLELARLQKFADNRSTILFQGSPLFGDNFRLKLLFHIVSRSNIPRLDLCIFLHAKSKLCHDAICDEVPDNKDDVH